MPGKNIGREMHEGRVILADHVVVMLAGKPMRFSVAESSSCNARKLVLALSSDRPRRRQTAS